MSEDASGFLKGWIGVNKSPNPVGVMFAWERQLVVLGVVQEIFKLGDTTLVVGSANLQCRGKPECKPAHEKPKQKDRLP